MSEEGRNTKASRETKSGRESGRTIISRGGTTPLPPINSTVLNRSEDIATRGFSRKLNDLIKSHRDHNVTNTAATRLKFEPKNWYQLTANQLTKIDSVQRSRYERYEAPPKDIVEKQVEALKRVRVHRTLLRSNNPEVSITDMIEKEENSELIGQLKAAEARYRIRYSRITYEQTRKLELQHLIISQPTAQESVRLESFLPLSRVYVTVPDHLSRFEKARCETILEDVSGLTLNRTL